jgi:hypothetical protein
MASCTVQINYTELPAVDLVATKAFYSHAFGWEWTDYGPGYAACEGGAVDFALSDQATVGPAHDPGEQSGVGPLILLGCDDLDAATAAVRGAGGSIVTEAYEYPGGRRFHFADPSGNVLGVYQSVSAPSDD